MIVHDSIFPATLAELSLARKQVRRSLDDLRFAADLKDDLELLIAEAGSNPIRHGSPKPKKMKLTVMANSRGVELIIADDGGTSPDALEQRHTTLALTPTLATSGRGMSLIASASDRYTIERRSEWNIQTLFRRHMRHKPRILVAEDSDATLAFFSSVLEGRFSVSTARTVEELKLQLDQDIDLLISDLHLGDSKSSDLLATLESTRDGLKVPIILVTADTTDLVMKEALRLGIETVLTKPVRAKQMLDAIDKALAARAHRRMNEARQFNHVLDDIIAKPDFSSLRGFDIGWHMGTADTGGGDLLIDLGGTTRRRIVIADLMGHGVMARARSAVWAGLLRGVQSTLMDSRPHAFLNSFSSALMQANMPDHVTGTLLVVDLLDDGSLELATAGHPAPLLLRNGRFEDLPLQGSFPGLSATGCTDSYRLVLGEGERLIAATDGVDPEGLAYRIVLPESAATAAFAMLKSPAGDMSAAMAKAIDASTGFRPNDDWTLLVVAASPQARA